MNTLERDKVGAGTIEHPAEKISLTRMVLVNFTDGNKRVHCILSDLRLDLNKTSTSLQTIDTGEHF